MLRILSIASLLAACSSKAPPPTTTQPSGSGSATAPAPTPAPTPVASETSCTTDADCVAVETKCCDHCNGGIVLAFNQASAASHQPTGCEKSQCTERGCGQAVPKCEAGTCQITIAPIQ